MAKKIILFFFLFFVKTTCINAQLFASIDSLVQPTSCLAPNDSGHVYLKGNSGAAPYTFAIHNYYTNTTSSFSTNNVFSLTAGSYYGIVQDALGNLDSIQFYMNKGFQIQSVLQTPTSNCIGDSICVSVVGSTAPYLYSYTLGTFNQTASSCFLISPISIGQTAAIYTITATSAEGCTAYTTVAVNILNGLTVNAAVLIDSSCSGGNSSASVAISGGIGPFITSWSSSPVQTTLVATNLPSGIYTCTVTTANGCSSTTSVNLLGNNSWYVNAPSLCKNQISYGFINSNYPFTTFNNIGISPSTGATIVGSNIQFSPFTTTAYTVTATPSSGCQSSTIITVAVSSINNSVALVNTPASCLLINDGVIVANTSLPNNNLHYQWSNSLADTNIITNVSVGNYTVIITDSNTNGCIALYTNMVASGTNCGNIVGKVLLDSNNNCIADATEHGIPNQQLMINPGGIMTFTDNFGNYSFNGLGYGTYTINATSNSPFFNIACANNLVANTSAISPIDTVHFFDTITNGKDFYIGGFSNCLNFASSQTSATIYYGQYTPFQNSAATVYCIFDSIQQFVSSSIVPTSINGDTVFWNVQVGNAQQINVQLNVTSTTSIGTVFTLKTGITNFTGTDINPINNSNVNNFFVCNSFDPNDKQVSPQGQLAPGYVPLQQKYFTYKIRFQNTGTAPAVNVVVLDTLSNNVDINTFTMLGASHDYHITILPNNVLKITFPTIMLPDSNYDEPNSHGYFIYTIKAKNNLVAGNQIVNTANIYFDYNSAITTNTTINTLYSDLQIDSAITKQNTNCNLPCGNGAVTILATGGVQPYVHSISAMCTNTMLNNNVVSNLLAGNYTIQTTDALGTHRTKTITILPPTPIILNLTSIQPVGQAGSASVAPTGGTPPYDNLWQPGNFTTNSISNLSAGNYTINIVDAQGCSNGTSVQLNYATSIPSLAVDQFVQLFPNPAADNITIVSNADLGRVILFTNTGQIVYAVDAQQLHTININIQQLPKGQYNVQLGNGAIKKFLVE
jgi:hypothetical protein